VDEQKARRRIRRYVENFLRVQRSLAMQIALRSVKILMNSLVLVDGQHSVERPPEVDCGRTGGPQHLLHGDLHHFNILSVSEESGLGWRAIDPFGVVGEREVEIGAFVRNPNLALPITPELERKLKRRLDVFHEQLGLDLKRMIAWASVYAAVSAWWTISTDADGWQVDAALSDFFANHLG